MFGGSTKYLVVNRPILYVVPPDMESVATHTRECPYREIHKPFLCLKDQSGSSGWCIILFTVIIALLIHNKRAMFSADMPPW